MSKQKHRLLAPLWIIASSALLWAPAGFAASDAAMEAEAAREFAKLKASAPLTTNREVIDYIACVQTLSFRFSNRHIATTTGKWRFLKPIS